MSCDPTRSSTGPVLESTQDKKSEGGRLLLD